MAIQNAITFTAYAEKNLCYKAAQAMPDGSPAGIIVHSTGANNPYLKRYVDCPEICGENIYGNHWNTLEPAGANGAPTQICCHAFIGKDKDGIVRAAKLLPWTICCWDCGSGSKGSYNFSPAYIQIEVCEDDLTDKQYFEDAFALTAQLCARLMKIYPTIKPENVISHKEANARGYASNHGDCDNWLGAFGKNMDWFRELVQAQVSATNTTGTKLYRVQIGAFSSKTNAENYLAQAKSKGLDGFVIKVTSKLYRVQVGAFSSRENAENYAAKIKQAGFNAFVVQVEK